MNLSVFLCLIGLSQVMANGVFAQKTKLSIDVDNVSIESALLLIENQSAYKFIYNKENVDLDAIVSLHAKDKTINEILNILFKGDDVNFVFYGTNVVLTKEDRFSTGQLLDNPVKGRVTDSSGESLPGVTVVIKGTTTGAVTDMDGNYVINDVPSESILVFSFVGMESQEISVNGQTVIDVVMEDNLLNLDEVVVIGYGLAKKSDITGAVAQADLQTYDKVPVNNVLERLKGTVAGLNVSGVDKAGGEANFTIRGQNSQTAGNNPLIVVDGAIFNGSISDISANDIENVTVLKDASAAAVYGSRSANGVILIETKKGSGINGKPKFEVQSSYGVSDELKPLKVYDADGYIQRLLDIREMNGLEADPSKIEIYLTTEEQKNYVENDHRPTIEDPYSLFRRMGHSLNTTVSLSNRTDKTRYYISGNLIRQNGVIIRDDYKSLSGRINLESDLTDWFNLGIKSFYSLRDYSGSTLYGTAGSGIGNAPQMISPYASIYNPDGSYTWNPQTTSSFTNPFRLIGTEDIDKRNDLNAIITSVIKIPWVKGLTYNLTFSNALRWSEGGYFYNEETYQGRGKNGIGERTYDRTYNMLLDNIIKYNRVFQKHAVDVTLLYSHEKSSWENMESYAENFDNTSLGTYKLENGAVSAVNTGGGETQGIGLMARANYTFDDRYSITGTVRRDGYSAFSKNKKWGTFSSAGLNWNITQENFLKESKALDNLAVRVSYGTNGNQSISAYQTLAKIGTDQIPFYGDPSYTLTQYVSSLPNNELGWESTTGLNLGLDFAVLDNRLQGSVDAYQTRTNDLMFSLPLPMATGNSSIVSNIGEIRNKGIEFSLNSLNMDRGDFTWRSSFAFSLNRNKVETILGEDLDGDGKEDDLISAGYFIGRPLGTIYGYKVDGMWQQEDVENGTIMTGMLPGTYIIEDVDGDGKITSDMDRQFIGTKKENFRWSLTNTLQYKGFSLMLYVYSIWGGHGYYLSDSNTPYNDPYVNNTDINRPVYDYWTPTNTSAMFPRPNYGQVPYRGIKYFDRSFIKLQKVSLTYDFTNLVKPWGIQGLSCSLSADNLFTYAPHWVGLDPETDNGLTVTSIAPLRIYMVNVMLNF